MKRLVFAIIVSAAAATDSFAAANAAQILQRMDSLYRADTSAALVEMEIVTPDWQRTMKFQIYSQGKDKTFVDVIHPLKDKGIRTLRLNKEMWNYFPKINKTMKIPPSMMMNSWMGSDFTNDDLVREVSLAEDFTAKVQSETADKVVMELNAKPTTVTVWPKVVLVVALPDLLPLQYEYFDEKGSLARTMVFSDVKTFSGRKIPATMEVLPAAKKGHKTIFRYLEAAFDTAPKRDVFTLRHLQSGS